MRPLAFFCALLALLLSGCGKDPEPVKPEGPYPALWEIVGDDRRAEGWLFGTIHALPDDTPWRSPRLSAISREADLLVVEVANLDDGAELSKLFEQMAFDHPAGPIAKRIDPALRNEFDALLVKAKVRRSYFDPMESWAAALALAQVAQPAEAENGADRTLLADFDKPRIVELEGARAQLAIFDALPETEQRDLLDAVLEESRDYAEGADTLARAWLSGDTERLAELTHEGILADPELERALLTRRNAAWAAKIENLLSARDRPLIAVGAGHLLGPEGLPALLEARGYTVRRIE